MRPGLLPCFFIFTLAACTATSTEKKPMDPIHPPVAEKIPHELNEFDTTRNDSYFWLRDRENPKVIQYLKDENEYTEKIMSGYKTFREKLYTEMRSRIKEDDISVPYMDNHFYYYTRFEKGNEHPHYFRCKKLPTEGEELLLNVNELAKGKSYCQEGSLDVSPDNNWVAYSMDFQGRRKYQLYFKNMGTGTIVDDGIKNTTGEIAWCKDNKTVFYSIEDEVTLRPNKIMRHTVGTPAANDVCVYEEKDATYSAGVYTSKSGNYNFIYCYSTLSTEIRWLNANDINGKFVVFHPREKNLEYGVDESDNEFFIRTNWKAKNFRIMKALPGKTQKENWIEVVPHEPGVLVESFEMFNDYLVVEKRDKGLVRLEILNKSTGDKKQIKWDENDYTVDLHINEDGSLPFVRVAYTSLKTPAGIYDINLQSLERKLMKQVEVTGGYNPNEYQTERIYVKARDGKEVPVSLVYKKELFKKGQNPIVLYGYGSYGVNIDPSFVSPRLSLLNRGFVFAILHIRGSQTLGREWYEDGKMLNKKNSFTDFIDCTEGLVKQRYAHKDKVFAMGGSAGGLLMGAIVNMRPDLYKGILAAVPFVDVITTMMDESVPLTTGEYDEWGNPNDKAYYKYMLSYSPYDNVEKKDYPAMLVTTGLHDSQVQYWEPAKWVAKLRDYKTDKNILLLHTNMDAGHGGSSGRFEYLKEVALEYGFMFMLLDIKE
ncbi:MAG: S9 family peptidase [Flavobacteriales bacterium]